MVTELSVPIVIFFITKPQVLYGGRKKKTEARVLYVHLLLSLFIRPPLAWKGSYMSHVLQESVGGGQWETPLGVDGAGEGSLGLKGRGQSSESHCPVTNIFLDELSSAHLPRSPAACGLKAVGWARGGGGETNGDQEEKRDEMQVGAQKGHGGKRLRDWAGLALNLRLGWWPSGRT